MSKQFAAIPFPFVGQFSALAFVAMWASYNQVFRAIRPATRQRYYMIDVISVTYLLIAPIAFAMLGIKLALYVFWCVSTFGLHLDSTALTASYSAQHAGLFWMVTIPLCGALYSLFSMSSPPFDSISYTLWSVSACSVFLAQFVSVFIAITSRMDFALIGVTFAPFAIRVGVGFPITLTFGLASFADFFAVLFTVTAGSFSLRHITPRQVLGRLYECSRRRRNRFSGATLATFKYYTTGGMAIL